MKIINELLKTHPELKKNKKGVPFLGYKEYDLNYSRNAKKIVDSYSLYTEKLFDLKLSDNAIKNCTLDSGDPMKYKIFKPILKELKKINSKYDFYKYTRASGEIYSRKRVIEYMNNNDFKDLKNPLNETNVIFTMSTTHALNIILKFLGKKNDVIICPAPNYGLFTVICERLGMDVVYLNLDKEDNYLVNPKKLNKLIETTNKKLKEKYKNNKYIPKVLAFLNQNPNNPTGKVMGIKQKDILKEIGVVCGNNDVFVIDDLVYKDTTYDRDNIALPVGKFSSFDNTISLYGLSKSFGGAGLRSGIVIANNYVIKGIKNIIFQEMDSIPKYLSYSCSGAYNDSKYRSVHYKRYFKKLTKKYEERYKLLEYLINGGNNKYLSKLNKYSNKILYEWNGIKGVKLFDELKPESGFFSIVDFTDIKKILKLNKNITEENFYKYLYQNTGIKYIMGKSFGWTTNEFVGRINFGEDEEILIKTFLTLNEFIENKLKK